MIGLSCCDEAETSRCRVVCRRVLSDHQSDVSDDVVIRRLTNHCGLPHPSVRTIAYLSLNVAACLITSTYVKQFLYCCWYKTSQSGQSFERHISSPDVNMHYIRSLLFLDVCMEIVTVKQSAFSLFPFMCVYFYVCSCLYFTMCVFCFFIFFSRVSDSLSCWVCCMYVCYVL